MDDMAHDKLAVIGLDAADARLVRKWAGEGHLPTLAKLLESALVAPIETPEGVLEGGIWPTMLTGRLPATHGMFAFLTMRPGSYFIENGMYADRLPVPPFWTHIGEAGKRVAVVDAPFSRPLEGLNGVQITNWGVHDSWSWHRSSFPKRLVKDVVRQFGEHPVFQCDEEDRSLADYESLRAGLLAGVKTKTEVLRSVMAREEWAFFLGVYSESHCAGHQLWHFMDPSHPRHPPAAPATLRSAVLDVYRAIDSGLGVLLQELPAEVPVVVILSHGMGPYYAGSHLLEAVLDRLGFGAPAEAPGFPTRDSYALGGVRGVLWGLRRLLPQGVRRVMKARMRRPLDALWQITHPVASLWRPGARAFVIPSNNMTGAIRLNLLGREPFGAIAPGEEFERVCDELIAGLLELENPDTGERAVQWVRRARDLYRGPRLENLPDLFVEWNHRAPIRALRSPRIGTVTGTLAASRTGDHWQGGLLLARSGDFRRGEMAPLRTQDVAPTLLDLLGVEIPATYEGRSVAASMRVCRESNSA
jgi:predicted AlkP superfamily phosphohydrolase/phosphomutase